MKVQQADAYVALFTSMNARELSSIDPEHISRRSRSRKKINDLFSKKEEEGTLRWVGGPYPTAPMAQEASMSLEEYADFVYASCNLDKEDPVAEWERISAEQQKVCDWLCKRDEFRFVGRDTDLTMSCKGRTWVNCDGHINMPDGEVFTGPVEDSVNGKISFTYPAIYRGNEALDVKLEFKDGVVSSYSASKGEKFLGAMIGTDDGSNKVGEIAIGTNYNITRFTKELLFDEKIGGTMHLALGDGIVQSKSANRSSIHWDMLKDMKDGGKIYADGELFYENGKFLI
jgi:aminopeptidase